MYPDFGTVSKYPLPTFHFAGLPSFCAHSERSFPSNSTTPSEGARPTRSCVLATPGSTTVGAGRFMSCGFHCVCACPQPAPQISKPTPATHKTRNFQVIDFISRLELPCSPRSEHVQKFVAAAFCLP